MGGDALGGRWSSRPRGCALGIALAGLLAAASARGAPFVDYLHVRAGDGASSGGHAGIRFGEWTYDFQHERGLVRMRRQLSRDFQDDYRTFQNRPIELSRVPTSEETYALLRDAFDRHYLVQDRQIEILHEMQRDTRLLEALLERGGAGRFEVRGVAFFFPAEGAVLGGPLPAGAAPGVLGRLRARIETLHGIGFLAARRRAVAASLDALRAEPLEAESISLDPERYPVAPDSFSRRYAQDLAALFALAALERPRPLQPGVLTPPPSDPEDSALALDDAEIDRMRAQVAALLEDMAELAASHRPDWGEPLLLGMARLAALEQSIRSGRLVTLEALAGDAPRMRLTARRRALLPALLEEAASDLGRARAGWLGSTAPRSWHETAYVELEAAASRWVELDSARAGAEDLRVRRGLLVPEGSARVRSLPPLRGEPLPLDERLRESQEAAQRYRERLEAHYGYQLVVRNCVTEIFRTLDAALGPRAQEESERRLGGYVDPAGSLNFVPWVASHRVQHRYAGTASSHLPSYREYQLERMARTGSRLGVALRESNVLTATLYQPVADEGFFLFYTDGPALSRPLLGALNLVAGLAKSGVGLALLPKDRGRTLRSGLEGALFSVPELFFQNVRKGRNDYVPPAQRPPPG
jgi:hypothetical protein